VDPHDLHSWQQAGPPEASAVANGDGAHENGRARTVVLIEDSPDYSRLVSEMLREGLGADTRIHRFETVGAALGHLAGADCALLDLSLPDARGLDALRKTRDAAPELPIVVLSGGEDEDLAVRAVQEGAQDYLLKRNAETELLRRAIRYAVERKRHELELSYLALHDGLTGLANRNLFVDRVGMALARARRRSTFVTVLFCDLDHFKLVNDGLGHDWGDRLLIAVADRMKSLLRPGDTMARFGGDEFMVLCEDIGSEADALSIARRLRAGLSGPFQIGEHQLFVDISIGMALGNGPDATPEILIRNADLTMFRAKRSRTGVEVFEPGMHQQVVHALHMDSELHRALDLDELCLFFQPQVSLSDGRIIAVEALLRWDHPERGILAPPAFMEAAERTGLIVAMGGWVAREACARLRAWREEGIAPDDLMVCINLSHRELRERSCADMMKSAVRVAGIEPAAVRLEISAGVGARGSHRESAELEALRAAGFRIGIDDFGSGHSSLSALSAIPADSVKIDRPFIAALDADAKGKAVLESIVRIARAGALTAIAEGVESEEQARAVSEAGCDAAQGLHFWPPLAADETAALLRRQLAAHREPDSLDPR
jgi:diguanylate cyclase (GGDEF)-like protein